MSDEDRILQDVLDAPYDDTPRLAYANWCDRNQDLRGEFIRLQLELAAGEPAELDDPATPMERRLILKKTFKEKEAREIDLTSQYASTWSPKVQRLVDACKFHRGFVSQVSMSASGFVDRADELLALSPIVHVRFKDVGGVLPKLIQSPHLRYLRAISLLDCGLTNHDLRTLSESEHLENLWWLDVGGNNIDYQGVRTLASLRLPALTFVAFDRNPSDPREILESENYMIETKYLPQEGIDLEAEFGTIPWLHCHTDTMLEYPPDPLGAPLVV